MTKHDGNPVGCVCLALSFVHDRAVLNAKTTPCAEIHINTPSPLLDLHLEISGRPFHGFKIGVCDEFDV